MLPLRLSLLALCLCGGAPAMGLHPHALAPIPQDHQVADVYRFRTLGVEERVAQGLATQGGVEATDRGLLWLVLAEYIP